MSDGTGVVVFAGPTLTEAEVRAELPRADVRGPAAQGDVYAAGLDGSVVAIALIDGYFERVPAVWHKEILWAMTRGIHVFGAASMGALRAVELASFGMEGVGEIYEAFADGTLDRDDEVALVHGPAESGYKKASEALVNMRCTLMGALEAGAAPEQLVQELLVIAGELFYADRSYPNLFAEARARGCDPAAVSALAEHVARHPVDQKRDDALELLRVLRARLGAGLEPKRVTYRLERSGFFQHMADELALGPLAAPELVDEARLEPALFERAFALAALMVAAEREADQQKLRFDDEATLENALAAYRRARGLHSAGAFEQHLRSEDLDDVALTRLAQRAAMLGWYTERARQRVFADIPLALRLLSRHSELSRRAAEKRRTLERAGLAAASLADIDLDEPQLIDWYFRKILTREPPADVEAWARSTYQATRTELVGLALREYLYRRLSG